MCQQADFIIFYSWQNDNKFTKKYIRDVLNQLKKTIQNVKIVIDEATRDVSGSPDIVSSLCRKIKNADLFIADISLFPMENKKKTPNANVLFESGYASAFLGEGRVIFLLDLDSGSAENCPFDISHRRITSFCSKQEMYKKILSKCIQESIYAIIKKDPPKTLIVQELERIKDIHKLKRLLEVFNIDAVNSGLQKLPNQLQKSFIDYFEMLKYEYLAPSNRYFYDNHIECFFKEILTMFSKLSDFVEPYCGYSPNGGNAYLVDSSSIPKNFYDVTEKMRNDMLLLIDGFTHYLHNFYQEVDIHQTNRSAHELNIRLEEYAKKELLG